MTCEGSFKDIRYGTRDRCATNCANNASSNSAVDASHRSSQSSIDPSAIPAPRRRSALRRILATTLRTARLRIRKNAVLSVYLNANSSSTPFSHRTRAIRTRRRTTVSISAFGSTSVVFAKTAPIPAIRTRSCMIISSQWRSARVLTLRNCSLNRRCTRGSI